MGKRVTVTIRPKDGLRDPQGSAVRDALVALGYDGVSTVHVGKTIDLLLDGPLADAPAGELRSRVEEMCRTLLVNSVIETYTVALGPEDTAPAGSVRSGNKTEAEGSADAAGRSL